MTSQYPNLNINNPRIVRSATSNIDVTTDDELIVFDTSAAPITAQLPDAQIIPGVILYFKATNAGTTGNAVTISALGGQTIDGAASIQLDIDQQAAILQSDGLNFRVITAGGSAEVNGGWELVADIDYTTAAAHDFKVGATVVIDGITHTAINAANSASVDVVPGTGIQIVASSTTTNFIESDLSATRINLTLNDAGIRAGDEWFADFIWSNSLNIGDSLIAGEWIDGPLSGAGANDPQTRFVTSGPSTAYPAGSVSAQTIAYAERDFVVTNNAALYAASLARIRVVSGYAGVSAICTQNGAGDEWLSIAKIWPPFVNGFGLQGAGGEENFMFGLKSFNSTAGGSVTLEQIQVYRRPLIGG